MSALGSATEQAQRNSAETDKPLIELAADVAAVKPFSAMSDVSEFNDVQVNNSHIVSLTSDVDEPEKRFVVSNMIRNLGSLSSFVRIVGVAAVALSMCLFLLDGMSVVNDTQRFFTMLMLTGILSAGGFALAFVLKEQRGARSFFGLALLSVPVNFTVLGALFYSVFQLDSVATVYPTVAHWTIASIASLGSASLIALVALIPVTVICISVMGRQGRVWLSVAMLTSSSMLLLPIRDPSFIAPIVAAIVAVLLILVNRCANGIVSLKTPAGRFVQSLLFLPPVIMLFRSFWLYDVSSFSALIITLTAFVAIRYAGQHVKPEGAVPGTLHIVNMLLAIAAAILAVSVVTGITELHCQALIFSVVFGGLMMDVEHRTNSVKLARVLGIGAYAVLAFVILFHQQVYEGILVFAGGLLIPMLLMVIGITQKHKEKVIIAGLTLATTLLLNAGWLINFFSYAGWLSFASLGAAAIIVASLLERFGAMFSLQARKWFASS